MYLLSACIRKFSSSFFRDFQKELTLFHSEDEERERRSEAEARAVAREESGEDEEARMQEEELRRLRQIREDGKFALRVHRELKRRARKEDEERPWLGEEAKAKRLRKRTVSASTVSA